MKKKIEILEHAFAASAGAYYSVNLTQNVVPGYMYRVIDDRESSLNALLGLPENACFTDMVARWGSRLDEEEQAIYLSFFAIPHLLDCHARGQEHIKLRYRAAGADAQPILVEQHFVMFEDEENGDVLAISYVLNLTHSAAQERSLLEEEVQELHTEKDILEALCTDYLSIFYLDFAEKRVMVLKESANSHFFRKGQELQADFACYTHNLQRCFWEYVDQDASPDFAEQLCPENLEIYIKQGRSLLYRFKTLPVRGAPHYVEVSVFRVKAGDTTKAVMGYRPIDSIVAEEEQQRKWLEEQIHIIGGLTNAYFAVYRVDLQENRCRAVKNIDFFEQAVENCWTTDDVVNAFVTLCVMPEDQEKMREFTDWRRLAERLDERDTTVQEFHGQIVPWIWCRASWIVAARDETGRASEVLFTVEDISAIVAEQKKIEQEREQAQRELQLARDAADAANKAKSTFLFNMSHDIRTPMNAIVGYTELLRQNQDDRAKCDDYIEKIRTSSNFLLSIINNVLTMARIESGKAVLDEKPTRIGSLAGAVISVYAGQIKKKNLTLTYDMQVQSEYIYCDQVKLKELFSNLLSNAYKYTPEGGHITITTRELPCDKAGHTCMRTVIADTGIGMSKEYLPVLFEEFTRERTAVENKTEGTGLGMAIVKSLVHLLGGTIDVESEPGKGTAFTVTTTHRIAQAAEAADCAERAIDTAALAGRHILLAEDNDLNAEIATELLKGYDVAAERARNGLECIAMLEKAPSDYYDLILMDVQMPCMNGYQAAERIRQLDDPAKRNIPMIAMTANAFEEDRQNALVAGMDDHLAKPLDISRLAEKLAGILRSRCG